MSSLKERLRAGESLSGFWVSLSDPAVTELTAGLEFDFVVVDTEHTPLSYETVEAHVRAADAAGGTDTVVRVPWNDHVEIKRVLDTGAEGLLVPQVHTPGEARDLVEAVRYPPEGRRGLAAARASDYGRNFESYVEHAADRIAVIPQVESPEAVENADEIAAVDGVDALLIGPADLSASLDRLGEYDHSEFRAAVEETFEAAHGEGVPVGTLATDETDIERWVDLGFDYLVVGVDTGTLAAGAESARRTYEERR